MSRVRTRTHGSVGRRRLRPPLTRSLTALSDAAVALYALQLDQFNESLIAFKQIVRFF
jgi:hypothetical protein